MPQGSGGLQPAFPQLSSFLCELNIRPHPGPGWPLDPHVGWLSGSCSWRSEHNLLAGVYGSNQHTSGLNVTRGDWIFSHQENQSRGQQFRV